MCEQCTTACILWHEPILPGLSLMLARKEGCMMKAGDFGLVSCNDPCYVFSCAPVKDPYKGMSDEAINALKKTSKKHKQFDDFVSAVEQMSEIGHYAPSLVDGYEIIKAAMKLGYKPAGLSKWDNKKGKFVVRNGERWETWFVNHLAEFLEKWRPVHIHPELMSDDSGEDVMMRIINGKQEKKAMPKKKI